MDFCKAFIPATGHCLFRGQFNDKVYSCKHATGINCPSNGVYEVTDINEFNILISVLTEQLANSHTTNRP